MNSFSGYPNFMQNLTNPMQSGFSWSSFGNQRSNVRPNANKDTKFFQGNQNSGYYTSQAPEYESQNQLQRLREEIGNLSQKLGVPLPTGGVDMRQVLQNTTTQQPALVPKLPDARQILQEIYPGINAMLYCTEYCAKRKLQMEYILEQETGNGMGGKGKGVFTFALIIETYKGGPVLRSWGTDLGKSEAKQRAAEQMIPQLLQIFGPMSVNPSHFATNRKVGEPITKRVPQKRVSKWAKMTDEEWAKTMVGLPEAQSNPTSLLFQWAQHKRLPVPEYETTFEEIAGFENAPEVKPVIESPKEESESPNAKRRRTAAPSTPRMYTVYCNFGNKKFMGKDMDAKKAKMAASAAAWKEFCPKY